jgi:hypothetical protein
MRERNVVKLCDRVGSATRETDACCPIARFECLDYDKSSSLESHLIAVVLKPSLIDMILCKVTLIQVSHCNKKGRGGNFQVPDSRTWSLLVQRKVLLTRPHSDFTVRIDSDASNTFDDIERVCTVNKSELTKLDQMGAQR